MTNSTHFDPSTQETKEITYPVQSTLDDVGVDPTTDPDNSQIAASQPTYRLPPFLLADWQLSDDNSRLVPTSTYLLQVQHAARIENITDQQMTNLKQAAQESYGQVRVETTKGEKGSQTTEHPSVIDTLVLQYQTLIDELSNSEVFQIMTSVGDMVAMSLAERAVLDVRINNAKLPSNEPAPDWFSISLDKKYAAAANAGKWMEAHRQLWTYVGYNKEPRYYTDYAVTRRLRNLGEYNFKTHVYNDMKKATVAEVNKFVDEKYQC